MMALLSVTPRTGRFAGRTVCTNGQGRGLFTAQRDGTYQQHTGTSQTPRFHSAAHLAGWLRRHYPDDAQLYQRERRAGRV